MKIIIATNNQDKVRELREMLEGTDIEVSSLKEEGISCHVEENGSSFEENAIIKAEAVCKMTGKIVIADDSGLEIDYLGGAPGIYSARFMGEDTSYEIKNRALLDRLKDVPDEQRTARFVCAMAIAYPDGYSSVFRGTFEGRIGHESRGENGFGYDPIFYVPESGCSSAEMTPEAKNAVSHRGKALRMAVEELRKNA